MKALILYFQQHRIVSILVAFTIITIVVVMVMDQRGEQHTLTLPESSEQKATMEKFKSGTYKPAKEIGY